MTNSFLLWSDSLGSLGSLGFEDLGFCGEEGVADKAWQEVGEETVEQEEEGEQERAEYDGRVYRVVGEETCRETD